MSIESITEKLRDLTPERDPKLRELQRERERAVATVTNFEEKLRQREQDLLNEKHELERQLADAKRAEEAERLKKAA